MRICVSSPLGHQPYGTLDSLGDMQDIHPRQAMAADGAANDDCCSGSCAVSVPRRANETETRHHHHAISGRKDEVVIPKQKMTGMFCRTNVVRTNMCPFALFWAEQAGSAKVRLPPTKVACQHEAPSQPSVCYAVVYPRR